MVLAVIETGGKQYLIAPGQKIKIEKIKGVKEGEKIVFDKALLFVDEKGEITIGQPYISGMQITAECEELGRTKKIIVFRYHSKTRYKKKKSHRQPFMKVSIKSII
jgi:large subunit ribosomal protein L21